MEKALTVTELNTIIKDIIKNNIGDEIKVSGEVSNTKLSRGHLYFTLKDNTSMINVTFWSYDKKKNISKIKDGDKIIVTGTLNLYIKGGYYNINCFDIDIIGIGNIYNEYTMTKKSYETKGYFDEQYKKKLPKFIKKIGVLTALEGAALKDFLSVLEKGGFIGEVYVRGIIVQGISCSKSVADNIKDMDLLNLDVLIITRGGGSFEDLFGFSNSDVIESIHNAKTCIISAIGHEVDFMLSDYVADIRASTPSVAAELIAKHQKEQFSLYFFDSLLSECYLLLKKKINNYESELNNLELSVSDLKRIVNDKMREIDENLINIKSIITDKLLKEKSNLNKLELILNSNNPKKIFEQGYCVLLDHDDNKIVSLADYEITRLTKPKNKKLKLIFIDGKIEL